MLDTGKNLLGFVISGKITNFKYSINKMKDAIWPIERHELPKFISVTLLMFCVLGIQNLVRALKDSIVNTMIGTETISFLKFWGVMPAAFLFTMLYVKLVNNVRGETIFYMVMGFFLSFFAVFAFLIFPNYEALHLSSDKAQQLLLAYPNFKWFILLLSNWSFSLFYIIAELWPNIVFALLFWQFVNMISSVEESRRFYPLFGLFGQTGLLISGIFLKKLSSINYYLKHKLNSHTLYNVFSIQIVLTVVLLLGIIAILTFWFINYKILAQNPSHTLSFKYTKKKQTTLADSIKLILSSKYIMLIAILLICYGTAINLVEGPWKATVTKVHTTPTEFAAFVGGYLSYTGIFTILFVILGSNIVRKLGWLAAAIITPIMVFSTGMIFFITEIFPGFIQTIIASFVLADPALIAITIGATQNVLSKSSKYTLFDSTKEMSYVPLDNELKTKGKAAADVIGIKLGKSTSALLQSIIFVIVPTATYQSISVYLMFVFVIVCLVWIWAVKELAKEYKKVSNTD
ncbi:MAG: NTP/NDP exchange transporter [Rickettsiaceae bacterium]|nr:MAG: NTP/NDP exchange transporter [Rickettsiaceae bacterium]